MAEADQKLIAVGAIAVGSVFAYSALTGRKVLSVLQGSVKGQKPSAVTPTDFIAPAVTPVTPFTGAGGSASSLAADALKYQGAGYVWGGAPAKGIGNWDCSSFVNWCAGHDLGLPIPGIAGGGYDGTGHGPPTGVWLLWTGLTNVPGGSQAAQPGDICVWQTHMGIALGGGQMISALNSDQGTAVTNIDGLIPGEVLFVRRYA